MPIVAFSPQQQPLGELYGCGPAGVPHVCVVHGFPTPRASSSTDINTKNTNNITSSCMLCADLTCARPAGGAARPGLDSGRHRTALPTRRPAGWQRRAHTHPYTHWHDTISKGVCAASMRPNMAEGLTRTACALPPLPTTTGHRRPVRSGHAVRQRLRLLGQQPHRQWDLPAAAGRRRDPVHCLHSAVRLRVQDRCVHAGGTGSQHKEWAQWGGVEGGGQLKKRANGGTSFASSGAEACSHSCNGQDCGCHAGVCALCAERRRLVGTYRSNWLE